MQSSHSPLNNRFSKAERLSNRARIAEVLKSGRRFDREFVSVYVSVRAGSNKTPNDLPTSRLCIVVKKKYVRLATQRNYVRRVVREQFRAVRAFVKNCADVVVSVHIPPKKKSDYRRALIGQLDAVFRESGIT
jgi:ribonuclease P protein component